SELRKWVNDYNANPFPGESLPPRLSIEELLDRYHSHTKHCASCSKALARIKQLRIAITVLAAVTWAMIPLTSLLQTNSVILPLSFSAIFLLFGGLWFGLGRLEHRMYRGEEVPPRNLPKK
ncbi:MAG: cell death suppressor protein Lls1, partial [Cyanobacteria bacterium J06636_27]